VNRTLRLMPCRYQFSLPVNWIRSRSVGFGVVFMMRLLRLSDSQGRGRKRARCADVRARRDNSRAGGRERAITPDVTNGCAPACQAGARFVTQPGAAPTLIFCSGGKWYSANPFVLGKFMWAHSMNLGAFGVFWVGIWVGTCFPASRQRTKFGWTTGRLGNWAPLSQRATLARS
jgi:hypothetical protein